MQEFSGLLRNPAGASSLATGSVLDRALVFTFNARFF
jgi:hypothetical protein